MKKRLTYSAMSLFQTCRRAYLHRYVEEIVKSSYVNAALSFGRLWHVLLETYYNGLMKSQYLDEVVKEIHGMINANYPNRFKNEDELRHFSLATAMWEGYAARFANEPFGVEAVETQFLAPILNPRTGYPSQSFDLAGKIDAIFQERDHFLLVEHKTASEIDMNLIGKIGIDFQTLLYAYHCQTPVSGVLYNVIKKSAKRPKQVPVLDENGLKIVVDADGVRQQNTNGSWRQSPANGLALMIRLETDYEFIERLRPDYESNDYYLRQQIIYTPAQVRAMRETLWDVTQQILSCHRSDFWAQSTKACYPIAGAPCQYAELCASCDDPNIRSNEYTYRAAHEELIDEHPQVFDQEDLPF